MPTIKNMLEITSEITDLFPIGEVVHAIWFEDESVFIQTSRRMIQVVELERYDENAIH